MFNFAKKSSFRDTTPLEKRKEEASKIRAKYPDRVPVICEKLSSSSDIADVDKKKYLVPNDLTAGQFLFVIRKRLKLAPEKAIFIFIDNTLPTSGLLMSQLYAAHRNEDGFLYISYASESTFGSCE